MSLCVRPYLPSDAGKWDLFCETALQSTFLHSRQFLSYHQDRFADHSLILLDGSDWVGVFPAAPHPRDDALMVSHPGITYGGVLHGGELRGNQMVAAIDAIRAYYLAQGRRRLLYKAVPTIYHRAPAQDDLYALFRHGAKRVRCDLTSTVDLANRLPKTAERRRALKKAGKYGVSVVHGTEYLPNLWEILTQNLAEKHNARPVHSLDEIALLASRFPANIRCACAVLDGVIVAGVVLFLTPTVVHTQYIAANDAGRNASALDLIMESCIDLGVENGTRWFDFGISNEQEGAFLNDGLYRFKNGFGGGGYVHEFYEIDL